MSRLNRPLTGLESGPGATDHRNADTSIGDSEDGDREDWNDEENERIMTEECSEHRAQHEPCGYYGPQM